MQKSMVFILACWGAAFAALAPPQTASATQITVENTLPNQNGLVTIQEVTPFPGFFDGPSVGYRLHVAEGNSVYAFGVSFQPQPGQNYYGISRSAWSYSYYDEADWNNNSYPIYYYDATGAGLKISPTSLGTFDEVFGTADTAAFVFTRSALIETGGPSDILVASSLLTGFAASNIAGNLIYGDPITAAIDDFDSLTNAWLSSAQFGYDSYSPVNVASNFFALDGSGNLIDSSPSLVPEPSSFALCATSIAALAAMRRKRRAA